MRKCFNVFQCLAMVMLLLVMGCGPKTETKTEKKSGDTLGSAAVDVITQRTAVESGKKARAAIQKVQAQREQDYKDALGTDK